MRACRWVFWSLITFSHSQASELSLDQWKEELSAYSSVQKIQSRFRQEKYLPRIPLTLKSEGRFLYERHHEKPVVLWTITKPSLLEIRISESGFEMLDSRSKNPMQMKWSESSEAAKGVQQLIAWLRMDAQSLYGTYDVERADRLLFRLSPRTESKELPFSKVEMNFSRKRVLQKLTLYEKSGDVMTLHFFETVIQ